MGAGGVPPLLIAHMGAGSLGIISGAAAVSVAKGERAHRIFGTVFFVSMLIMSGPGAYLAVFGSQPSAGAAPPQASVAVGVLTFYLVATAWLTARRREMGAGIFERGAFVVAPGACAALLIFGIAAQIRHSLAIPYFVFAAFAALLAALDLKVIVQGGISGSQRIARHLWRMGFALFFATSFFFVGQQKVMPVWMRGAPLLFVLGFAPLALLIFWLLRVRLAAKWNAKAAV
jgi:hypothetical protein